MLYNVKHFVALLKISEPKLLTINYTCYLYVNGWDAVLHINWMVVLLHKHYYSPIMNLLKEYKDLVNQKVSWIKFLDTFSNEDECLQLYFNLKFSECACKKCGRNIAANYRKIKNKKAFRCRSCHTVIYPFSDTVFRNSALPITSIFFIIYRLSSKKNSSALDISRTTGISYKTVHRLTMQIRQIMGVIYSHKMKGVVEVDEAFFGGGSKVYNWSSISTRKQPIIGILERDTKQVRMFLVDNRSSKTINKLIRKNVEDGSTIYTDSWRGYNDLSKYYTHESVDHSRREFVRGVVHTNSIENIWGGFKRNIRNAHIKITAKYVQLYVNEACWRYNSKDKSSMVLFDQILKGTFSGHSSST